MYTEFNSDNFCNPEGVFFETYTPCGNLQPGETLSQGESVWSCDGSIRLTMQGDGNLVLLHDTFTSGSSNSDQVVWAAHTSMGELLARGISATPPFRTEMQSSDGNLVVYDANNVPLWAASWQPGFAFSAGAFLAIQNYGMIPEPLVLYPIDPNAHGPTGTAGVFDPDRGVLLQLQHSNWSCGSDGCFGARDTDGGELY
jgi:hypothetical protein